VVNAIPAHIWRSAPDGAVQFVNQQWMDYTGLSQENNQGWGWVSVIHPAFRLLFPNQVIRTDDLARAMVDVRRARHWRRPNAGSREP